jgi:aerobic-type carbon monoxide dehydrogenase small subunit (CoxS/CutS family)
MAISLKVNGHTHVVDVAPDTPLLYVLRDELELNAAKFGCGLAQCVACTIGCTWSPPTLSVRPTKAIPRAAGQWR